MGFSTQVSAVVWLHPRLPTYPHPSFYSIFYLRTSYKVYVFWFMGCLFSVAFLVVVAKNDVAYGGLFVLWTSLCVSLVHDMTFRAEF